MALNNLGLGFVLTARDMASAVMRRVGGSVDQLKRQARAGGVAIQSAFGVAAAGAIALAGGVGIVRGAYRAATEAGQFGQELARVGALSRASAEELGRLRDAAIQAGIATQFSPTEAVQGLRELSTRGFNASESIDALSGVLDLAAGGTISVAQSAQTLGAALRAFGRDASDAAMTTDQLLRITNMTSLQANEMALALGNVSRGAGIARQSLEEMLPAVGLVRNTGVEASVAASAVSSALIAMSQKRTAFQAIGVEVTRADGTFRDFLDIVQETSTALQQRYPNAAERSAEATRLFGRFGLTAFQGISRQLETGIRNMTGQIVRGDEAIKFLRGSMRQAEGAAEEFRERLLSTFQGQVTLLRGTVQTLGVVLGEPFARVFRPVVKVITDALNLVVRFFNALPAEAKTAIAAGLLLAGVLATTMGGVTVLGVAIAVLIPVIKAAAIAIGVATAALLPLIAAMAAVTAGAWLMWRGVQANIGGMGQAISKVFHRIRLTFQAIVQLFRQGGLTGAVRDQMMAAENQGLLRFAIRIFAIGHRIQRFLAGVGEGLSDGLQQASPVVEALLASLRRLGVALGFIEEEGTGAVASVASGEFAKRGREIGTMVAGAFDFMANSIRKVVVVAQGIVDAFGKVRKIVGGALAELSPAFSTLGDAISGALAPIITLLFGAERGNTTFRSWGTTIAMFVGKFLAGLITAIAFIVRVAAVLISIWGVIFNTVLSAVKAFVGGFTGAFDDVWAFLEPIFDGLRMAWEDLASRFEPVGELVDGIKLAFSDLGAAILQAFPSLREWFTATDEGGGIMGFLGDLLAKTAGLIVGVLAAAIGVLIVAVTGIIDAFAWTGQTILWLIDSAITGLVAAWNWVVGAVERVIGFFQMLHRAAVAVGLAISATFSAMVDAIATHLDTLVIMLARVGSAIPEQFRPGFVTTVIAAGAQAEERIATRRAAAATRHEEVAAAFAGISPAAAEAEGRGAAAGAGDREAAELRAAILRSTAAQEAVARRPVEVTVEVDGEAIARAASEGARTAAEGEFSPVGVGL